MLSSKAKISVTVPRGILATIDRGIAQKRYRSRSAAIQSALEKWARAQRNAEIDAYYDSLTDEERAESDEWAQLGYRAFSGHMDRAARKPRPRRKR
jgi:Arc/MetJ-type ribon-helix-helix transcriptional regulator